MMLRRRPFVPLLIVLALVLAGPITAQEKKILTHEEYEVWKGIGDQQISRDGRWVTYALTLQDGDPELVIRNVADGREYRIARGDNAAFSAGLGHVVALIRPAKADVRQSKLDKAKPDDQPKASLVVLDLDSGEQTVIERVKSFAVPAESGDWIAYLLEKTAGDATPDEPEEPAASAATESEVTTDDESTKREPKEDGTTLVYRQLPAGTEQRFEFVTEYAASDDGTTLAYLTSTSDETGDGAHAVSVDASGGLTVGTLAPGPGRFSDLAVSATGGRVAFLTDSATYDADEPEFALHAGRTGGGTAVIAQGGTAGVPVDWWVSDNATPRFSKSGARLFFGTAPRPAPERDADPILDEEKVVVDIWNWKDPLLQPMQLLQAQRERNRTYEAIAHLEDGNRIVQIETVDLPDVSVPHEGDGDFGYGTSNMDYRQSISWEFPFFSDHLLVDVRSGERNLIASRHQGSFATSPNGGWAVWWDGDALAWVGRELARDSGGNWSPANNLTASIRHAVHNEDHDWPYAPNPYGFAGWLAVADDLRDDGAPLEAVIYDRYDIWAVDPAGMRVPQQLTSGYGREELVQLRYLELDRESEWVTPGTMLLSGLHEPTKDAGFWQIDAFGTMPPEQLVREPKRFGRPVKAEDADVLMYTRQDISEFPNLWVTGTDFSDSQQVTDANPQQDEYNWATADLTTWRSLDGEVLQGLVHKPENFDPTKKYPMIVYFYERNANNLHAHYTPTPHRSTIRPTWYASRGYVVFTPDITYQVGYPGESALKDVLSGVLHMIDKGYVDEENVGVQGHSWGGYQIAYLVTKTDIFKAGAGGAPVSNMTSAYGGIRWGSGMSRMFQYEKTQSRLGGTLWEAPLRYIENSPVFWADKVNTPLLMLHNDEDGAVPWEQGIEMFVALRRLGKPAWLVNYNGEPHWPTTYPNIRDWNIRMQQFFDHYLMDAPAPVWLSEGVPAVDKGKTLGLDLIEDQQEQN